MKKLIWASVALLLCGFTPNGTSNLSVESQELLENSSVKILSGMCQSDNPTSFGSGPLFEKGGKVYAITSEHVVYHNKTWCFWIQDNEGNRVVAELRAVDYAEGMALLEVSAKKNFAGLRSYNKLFDLEPVAKQENVIISGFPYRSNESIPDEHGYVHLRKSLLRLIPNVKYLIEIIGSLGEFGMSGAAVYRLKTMGIVGMLSHQYLEVIEEGKPPVVKERTSATKSLGVNRLLVIPAQDIMRWLDGYFKSPDTYEPAMVRDADLQYLKQDVVFSGGLMFTMAPFVGPSPVKQEVVVDGPNELFSSQVKVTKGVGGEGIGGEGIGGEGIGGEGIGGIPSEGPPVRILVEKDPKGVFRKAIWPYPHRADWVAEKFRQLQTEEAKIEIHRFSERVKGMGERPDKIVTHSFSSLGNFFTLMRYNDTRPSCVLRSSRSPANDIESTEKVKRIAEKLLADCDALRVKATEAEIITLARKINSFALVLRDDKAMLEAVDARNLQPDDQRFTDVWNSAFTKHSKIAGDIYRGLLDAEDHLQRGMP